MSGSAGKRRLGSLWIPAGVSIGAGANVYRESCNGGGRLVCGGHGRCHLVTARVWGWRIGRTNRTAWNSSVTCLPADPGGGIGIQKLMARESGRTDADAPAFEMFFNYSVDAMLSGRPDGGIVHANPAACEMFRATLGDLRRIGRQGISNPDHPAWQTLFEQRGRQGWGRGIVPMSRLDGSTFTADVTSAIYSTPEGEDRTCIIVRDVTEHLERDRNRDAYNDVVAALLAGADIAAVLAVVARHARIVFEATDSVILAAAEPPDDVLVVAADGPKASGLVGRPYPQGTFARQVLETRQPLLLGPSAGLSACADVGDKVRKPVMLVPVFSGQDIFGVLCIGSSLEAGHAYRAEDLGKAAGFAERAALAIAMAETRARTERQHRRRAEQLQTALDSRVVLEQAKGMISALRSVTLDEAFQRIRTYARSHNQDIHFTARAVTERKLIV